MLVEMSHLWLIEITRRHHKLFWQREILGNAIFLYADWYKNGKKNTCQQETEYCCGKSWLSLPTEADIMRKVIEWRQNILIYTMNAFDEGKYHIPLRNCALKFQVRIRFSSIAYSKFQFSFLELHFLILRYLESGPCKEAAKVSYMSFNAFCFHFWVLG